MNQNIYTIKENKMIARDTFEMRLEGDTSAFVRPGQFVNIKLPERFLRRPISVCDWDENGFVIIYKCVGDGTRYMSELAVGEELDILVGLGNGFDVERAGDAPLIAGGDAEGGLLEHVEKNANGIERGEHRDIVIRRTATDLISVGRLIERVDISSADNVAYVTLTERCEDLFASLADLCTDSGADSVIFEERRGT